MVYTVPEVYERHATVLRVVDGDTWWIEADLGCDTRLRMTVRAAGINCPEMRTPEGQAAAMYALSWVTGSGPLVLRTEKDRKEKYGRYLGDLLPVAGGQSLCQALLDSGHAVPYP